MNVVLWILQAFLALMLLTGGAYKVMSRDELAKQFSALSSATWVALGLVEVVGGVLLIVPAALSWQPILTPIAAVVVAAESLLLVAVYGRRSRAMNASNPLTYAVVIGSAAVLVALGRFAFAPIA